MDEGFYSRPEERAQLRFRRLSQALKLDDDTDEEDEAGGAPGVHHSSTRECADGDVFLALGRGLDPFMKSSDQYSWRAVRSLAESLESMQGLKIQRPRCLWS